MFHGAPQCSLSNIFNILPANSPLRLAVFTAIVDLAVASDDMDLVLPQLQYVPSWINEWGVGLEAERTLLLSLADRLKDSGNPYVQTNGEQGMGRSVPLILLTPSGCGHV